MQQQLPPMTPAQQHSSYRPFGLLAELTYRCPLHCPYCSNPLQLQQEAHELTTEEWQRVIREASRLGILHILFSGGEPLVRKDLAELVSTAHDVGIYTNLITGAPGLTRRRIQQLQEAGLDSIQISFQADEASLANSIAGKTAHEQKLLAAQLVRECAMPLTINVVLHRANITRLSQIITLAEQLDAQRLELANTQFLGWALQNRDALLPTHQQVEVAAGIARAAQRRLRGKMEVVYVLPDYYLDRPKPCMYGWGHRYLTVNPYGSVLPCQTASSISSLHFDTVREHSLDWLWHDSEAFIRFRDTSWMPEPCQGCPRKEIDFGGCRCQAFLLTGNAANTDPVCSLSPHHQMLVEYVASRQYQEEEAASKWAKRLIFRTQPRVTTHSPSSKQLTTQ